VPCGSLFITVTWTVAAHYVSAPTLSQANAIARQLGADKANATAFNACHNHDFGNKEVTLP
jgi:hypothetical protein